MPHRQGTPSHHQSGACYPQLIGITKEMMSHGPQVADMEYRETAWPVVSTCTDRDPLHHHSSRVIMRVSTTSIGFRKTLGLAPWGTSQVLWWVSFQYLRHLSLLHLLLLLIMWHLLGHYALCPISPWWLTLRPSKWVALRDRFSPGRSSWRFIVPFSTILVTFHNSSPHLLTFWDFWVYWPKKELSLISWEEGDEGPKPCS